MPTYPLILLHPLALRIRKIVDPLVETGEIELKNQPSAGSPGYSDNNMGLVPSENSPAACLLGALSHHFSGGKGSFMEYNELASLLKTSTEMLHWLEEGFEGWSGIRDTESEGYRMGRELALHYGLL